ncbi:MAG: trypsin-like peptidase domain-containing protein [Ardenticatenaceae bacterium]|nr:trypsin-like peptidase domain-containing protein [Anaerolineales bacterium]MCB8941143.1 trypsin-like peptidase domain-containing protein [Ardenticatenaceae bacterium]MCB8972484.1 trypsin-like peptidase domain-containing protein [Ardenticatenaceae bacterium]
MKRTTYLLTFLALFGLMLAACGSTTAAPAESDTAVTSETTTDESGIVSTSAQTNVAVQETAQDISEEIVTTQTYIDLYNQLNDSVVTIQVISEGTALDLSQFQINPDPNNPDQETPDLPNDFHQQLETVPQQSQGSGFVYDKEGHIITNNHVVADATHITVIFADDTEAEAEVVGTDPGSDLAVIQVEVAADRLHPVTIGNSSDLQVGQLVATIGNPFGLSGSMSTGVISGLDRSLPSGASAPGGGNFTIPEIIQTDAAINPGNSGGPLLNLDGEVIGINTAIQTNGTTAFGTPTFGGIGYVVPSNILTQVVPQLIENGGISYPWLGISGTTLDDDLARAMDLSIEQNGVLVYQVLEGGPAAEAGLKGSEDEVQINGLNAIVGGDIITKMNDQVINDFNDLLTYIVRQTSVGQTVTLEIIRDGETQTLEVTLQARPN